MDADPRLILRLFQSKQIKVALEIQVSIDNNYMPFHKDCTRRKQKWGTKYTDTSFENLQNARQEFGM